MLFIEIESLRLRFATVVTNWMEKQELHRFKIQRSRSTKQNVWIVESKASLWYLHPNSVDPKRIRNGNRNVWIVESDIGERWSKRQNAIIETWKKKRPGLIGRNRSERNVSYVRERIIAGMKDVAGEVRRKVYIVESLVYLTVVIAWWKNYKRLDLRDEKGVVILGCKIRVRHRRLL